MKKFYLTTILFFIFRLPIFSQDLESSHLLWNISTFNQGGLTGNNNAHFTFDYRQSVLTGNIKYSSSLFWLDYPILQNGANTGALYFSFENEIAGSDNKFKTFKSNVGISKKISINRQSYLNFGLGAEYQQQTLSLDNLTTGSQFTQGVGFNRSVENGESSSFYNASFFAINSGIYIHGMDPQKSKQLIMGLSINNINKPIKNWEGISATQPSLWSAQFQYLSFTNPKIALGPDGFIFKEGNTYTAIGGATLRWYLGQSLTASFDDDYDNQYLNVFARISTQSKGIIGIQYRQEKYAAGISTDVPFGKLNQHYRNGFELFFSYIPRINGKTKRSKVKASKSKQNTDKNGPSAQKTIKTKKDTTGLPIGTNERNRSNEAETIIENQSDSLEIESKSYAGEIISNKVPTSSSHTPIYFLFNSSELDENSKKYLKELHEKLLNNTTVKLELIGHTDNIGSFDSNQQLSIKRAKVVEKFLIDLGIDKSKIHVSGKGEHEPIAPNDIPENRAKNRRVELKIIDE